MGLAGEIGGHLPLLRRYARALTGNQQHGDAFVCATLEALLAEPAALDRSLGARVGLYRVFHRIWESGHIEDGEGRDAEAPPPGRLLQKLASITPLARQTLLLCALEGFTSAETAAITGTDIPTIDSLLAEAEAQLMDEGPKSVLIIEDEPLISMAVEAIVADMGHRVIGIATTHADALAICAEQEPGLILADVKLADGSSGIEAVQDLLRRCPAPVIFITAFPERLLTGARVEPAFLVFKPFRPATLRAAISQCLMTAADREFA